MAIATLNRDLEPHDEENAKLPKEIRTHFSRLHPYAVVHFDGKIVICYLGKWNFKASKAKYDLLTLIAEWLTAG